MEKNVQTELELSEEQLQEITGGCDACTTDRAHIDTYQRWARSEMNRADQLRLRAQTDQYSTTYKQLLEQQATAHTNQAGIELQKVATIMEKIAARGHS